MLTHVNDQIRYAKIKSTSKFLDAGIAMSKHHAREIELKKLGLKKVFYVLPPHDNDQMFKKLNFGIFQIFTQMVEKTKETLRKHS